MKEESGYILAIKKAMDVEHERLGGRSFFRVKHEGKIFSFSCDGSLLKWILSL
jgi:hypothetical protein